MSLSYQSRKPYFSNNSGIPSLLDVLPKEPSPKYKVSMQIRSIIPSIFLGNSGVKGSIGAMVTCVEIPLFLLFLTRSYEVSSPEHKEKKFVLHLLGPFQQSSIREDHILFEAVKANQYPSSQGATLFESIKNQADD